jgi:hypothetical protein
VLTTDQLKQRLTDIEKIIHAFARLANEPTAFEKPTIYSISKSSLLSIEVGNTTAGLQHAAAFMLIQRSIKWGMDRL